MENHTGKLNFFTTARFLWGYMKDKKLQYFLFYIGWLFHTIVGVITPIIFGIMINRIVYYNDLRTFIKVGLVFFYATVFGIILYYMIYEMYAYLWNGINRGLRMDMFEQLQSLSAAEMVSLQYGDTVNMIQFWSMTGVNFVIRNIVHNANNIFRIVLCIVIIFRISPLFGAVSAVMIPLSVFTAFKIGSRIRKNSEKSKEKYAGYISWLFEIISSLSELRFWSAEKVILKKYNHKLDEMNQLNSKIAVDNTAGNELLANIRNVILVIQYVLLACYAVYGGFMVGTVTVMLTYFTMLSNALSDLAKNSMDAQERIAVIERIYAFLRKEKADCGGKKCELKEKISTISFENCSFQYSSGQPAVLDSLNFSVRQGEKVAIVGSSGAGKSTLLNLVLGLYQPQEGKVLLNGKDLTQYNKVSLYDHISVVFQQVLLLKGTIRENLLMGSGELPEEELVKACRAAGIYEYIRSQENGFDMEIERWGRNLSGGQKQRIGLARAYLRDSDLIIMDEATASLDRKNEELILENWDEILYGRTCLVVSHRLSTVMKCDRIILLKNGRIQKIGTPEEMKERCPEFRELFAM